MHARKTRLALVCGLLGLSPAAALRMERTGEKVTKDMEEAAAHLLVNMTRGLPKEFNTSRLRILSDVQTGILGDADSPYDCETYPHMCKAPFHCESWTMQDTIDVRLHGLATEEGHANLRSWCMPGLERYAGTVLKECVANHDTKKSAKLTLDRTFKDWADELDASYCFAEGHCTNEVMNEHTTLNDMETMCDWRYGRKGWTRNFLKSLKRLFDMPTAFTNLASQRGGFTTQRVTRVIAKMACAQGIFHCDVEYCKRTYCRDEYYVKKYQHLLPMVKGHLVRDPDMDKLELARGSEE